MTNIVLVARHVAAQRARVGRVLARAISTQQGNVAVVACASSDHDGSNRHQTYPFLLTALLGSAIATTASTTNWKTRMEEAPNTASASACPFHHETTANVDTKNHDPKLQATSVATPELPGSSSAPPEPIQPDNIPPPRPDLPTYTMEEVSEHAEEDDMWFTFRGAVYNMSFFAQGHPGGFPVRRI
mmetsp:Transcript_29658/g.61983  ORF Transcript_29658/g.61983 Transcript_29658/m.61983 type:complete len:186 (+) Transcript_29658:63-620(+)